MLKAGIDYTITYKNHQKAAAATNGKAPVMIIKGKKNFTRTIIRPFTIEQKSLDDPDSPATVHVADKAYSKKAGAYISKSVIKDTGDSLLKAGKDYEVSYTNAEGVLLTKKDTQEAES